MSFVFVDVDTVNDFFEGGKLAVPNADKIKPNLKKLTQKAKDTNIKILSFNDAHPKNAPEFDVFPPHCLIGTSGADKIPETQLSYYKVSRDLDTDMINHFDSEMIIFEKNTYNAFDEKLGNPNIDVYLKHNNVTDAIIYGVVSEICVNAAVIGFINRGINVYVVQDAIMHLDENECIICFEKWAFSNVKSVTTEIVIL